MAYFRTGLDWLDRLAPEGIPVPASILISGPGGSGKPLVALAFAASWLRKGGQVIFIPLQYPDPGFIEKDLQRFYDLALEDYRRSFCFLEFDLDLDPEAATQIQEEPSILRANLVNPQGLKRGLEAACLALGGCDSKTLVLGSALNLLLFSPTYGARTLAFLEATFRDDKSKTYLFTVSSSALSDKIEVLERAADHLFFVEMKRPEKELHLWVERIKGAAFTHERVIVPFRREDIEATKNLADASRVARIPAIRKI